ncbi:hypothetical protein DL95DRAFT_503495 [Leptodontidium sp. 2 PMI_412]|nr:hypothetical protein DL95DRAFT_503495 [Leptodontidium sp. 2 PMI_412]
MSLIWSTSSRSISHPHLLHSLGLVNSIFEVPGVTEILHSVKDSSGMTEVEKSQCSKTSHMKDSSSGSSPDGDCMRSAPETSESTNMRVSREESEDLTVNMDNATEWTANAISSDTSDFELSDKMLSRSSSNLDITKDSFPSPGNLFQRDFKHPNISHGVHSAVSAQVHQPESVSVKPVSQPSSRFRLRTGCGH